MRVGGTRSFAIAIASVLLLTGCSKKDEPPVPGPRPVKIMRAVSTEGDVARVVGVVRARERTTLAFQVAGRISSMSAEVGGTVNRDDVVAILDRTPFDLRVSQARAEVARANATATEARARLARQEQLLRGNWVAPASVASVQAEAEATQSALDAARATEALARRDLAQTTLVSPFSGQVARRFVEPFSEISVGTAIFEIDAATGFEAVAPVPAGLLSAFRPGAAATLHIRNAKVAARVERVSPRTGEAGTVDVIVRLSDSYGVRSGDAVAILVEREPTPLGVMVPLAALLLSDRSGRGTIFVVEGSRARRRPVTYDTALGTAVRVTSGVSAGEIVVAAGAQFLNDGETVSMLASRVH